MSDNFKSDDTFHYTYSAKQQQEIKEIRKKYLPAEEDKMAQIRRLDESASVKGTIAALVIGIPSCLLLGLGMCCTMIWGDGWFIPGIIIGVIGIAGMVVAYPAFVRITQKERERIAPQILKLTDELLR